MIAGYGGCYEWKKENEKSGDWGVTSDVEPRGVMRGRKRKKNRTSLYLVMMVIGIFLTTLVVQGVQLRAECNRLSAEQAQLEEKKKQLEKEQDDISRQAEYQKTDQYIEDVAREKFGLIYDNEIIFKAVE